MAPLTFIRCAACTLCCAAGAASALEGGVDTYGLGAEGTLAGALPPTGLYGIVYQNHYQARRLADDSGHSAIPGFRLYADSVTPRLILMTDTTLAGGQLGYYALMPLVDLRVSVPGKSDSRTGKGDLLMAPLLAYHSGMFHWGYALEFVMPVGDYDRNRLANIGRNYFSLRPIFGWSFHDPEGWDASTKMSLTFNRRNGDTDYRSGSYFAGDYNIGYRVRPHLRIGLEGYFLSQFSDDKLNGAVVSNDGNRAQVFGVGGGVQYEAPSGWSVEGKVVKDTSVRNRADGTSLWIRAAWRF
ncbi:transporter [Paucibacter sp. R3-3]|uniref:Transporter n=1 Tax=Roseateles agri TaxID=3098619 RepID=A0ABU5DRR8_9BURK|nr:transporter [Paucibacter sp. R3-3]MDY0749016.1 transporter [Paucibacter sp. R3-3]